MEQGILFSRLPSAQKEYEKSFVFARFCYSYFWDNVDDRYEVSAEEARMYDKIMDSKIAPWFC